MLTATSVVSPARETTGATSLAEGLFENIGHAIKMHYTPEVDWSCDYCNRTAITIVGDTISVVLRHDGKYHRTVIPFYQLGLKRDDSIT